MRTIGGFIHLEKNEGQEYHQKSLRFNLGRSALVYAGKALGYTRVWLPYYLCDSVESCFRKNGIETVYYHITEQLRPAGALALEAGDAVLLVNYLGLLSEEEIAEYYRMYDGNIIVDNTQAFFAKWENGVQYPTVYTCRKWFGVPDGAYLSGVEHTERYEQYEKDSSAGRLEIFAQKYEDGDAELYGQYRSLEENYDGAAVMKMSAVTQNLLRAVDYGKAADARRRNWKILHEMLGDGCAEGKISGSVPFMYDLYTEKAEQIRKKLCSQRIFLPTLWPNVLELDSSWIEYRLAKNVLWLPLDQRYTAADMEYLGECVRREF